MRLFKKTTHLSSIIEDSEGKVVTIFKYSDDCGTSSRLADKIENEIVIRKLEPTITWSQSRLNLFYLERLKNGLILNTNHLR